MTKPPAINGCIMTKKFYAHSLPNEPPGKWQGLEEHLCAVASRAEALASDFDSAAWARDLCGGRQQGKGQQKENPFH